MLVIASLIAALAGLTGASSLARCLSNATGQPQGTSVHSRKVQAQGQAPLAGKVLGHAHSFPVPASLSSQASLIASLLDDAEIQLRVLARQKPGPQRSTSLVALVESYQPDRQPKAYDMRGLGPVFQHISTVLSAKSARLLDEDQGGYPLQVQYEKLLSNCSAQPQALSPGASAL